MVFTVLAVRRELTFQFATLDFEGHALGKITRGDGADDTRRFADGMREAADQRIHRIDPLRPGAGGGPLLQTLGDTAFLANHLADPIQVVRGLGEHLSHLVKSVPPLCLLNQCRRRGGETLKSPLLQRRKGR